MTTRIIIGISGASGFQYGVKALELLRPHPVEVHLVVSKGAEKPASWRRITAWTT